MTAQIVAHKIWHFRMFWGIIGWEKEDWDIACEMVDKGIKTDLQIHEKCKEIFHDTLQEHIIDDEIEITSEDDKDCQTLTI